MKKFITFFLLFLCLLIFTGCSKSSIKTLNDLNGQKIGVYENSAVNEEINEYVKNPKIKEYKNNSDLENALIIGDIDAYYIDEPVAKYQCKLNNNLSYISNNVIFDYGYALPKNEKGLKLQKELNEFLYNFKVSKKYVELESKWFNEVNMTYDCNYKKLANLNGELNVIISKDDVPFTYEENGELIGLDIEILTAFAKAKGYGLNFIDKDFSEWFNVLEAGECDIVAGCLTITDERKELAYFTDPITQTTTAFVIYNDKLSKGKNYNSINELEGKTIGVYSGTIYDEIAVNNIKGCKIKYYDSQKEILDALSKNEIDAIVYDEPMARYLLINSDRYRLISEMLKYDEYGFVFSKSGAQTDKLVGELNEFIKEIKENEELKKIDDKYFTENDIPKKLNYESLPNINGRIRVGIAGEISEPFAYKKDGEIVGYDIDILVKFCEKYGYALTITDESFTTLFNSLESNKYDMLVGCITINNERKEKFTFTNPTYMGGVCLIVKR